jgi:hypothetical protein
MRDRERKPGMRPDRGGASRLAMTAGPGNGRAGAPGKGGTGGAAASTAPSRR